MDLKTVMLAEQLRDLQLKQKEKFKARVTKLRSKSSQQPIDRATDSVDAATMPKDDLGLMTATQERMNGALETTKRGRIEDVSGDGTLQQTLDNLRQQVKQLTSEKAGLSSRLRSGEKQLEALRKTLQEEHEIFGQGVGGIATTQKIVELSKKNRLLHSELGAERNHSRQLEKQMESATATQQVSKQESRGHDKGERLAVEDGEKLQLQLNELQEQLTQCKNKTADYRNQCQQLKRDLKLAHRVIVKEVGVGVAVSELLNSPSGWRGRSQQIITLQNKLLEMKNLLKKSSEGATERADVTSATDPAQGSREGGGRVAARQKAALEKMDRERKQNLEATRKELETVQVECARLHKECSALRARNKTLTEDVKLLKSGAPALRRNGATSSRDGQLSRSADVLALQSKMEELEQDNRLLRHQLQECELELQQKNSRPSSTAKVLSLPSLHKPLSHQTQPIRDTLSATVKHETYSLCEAQVLTQIAEAERDKLLDLTMTLQQRLDSTTDQLVRLKVENSCSRIHKLPNFGKCGINNGVAKQKLQSDPDSERVEALEDEVAILRDENAVVKETLAQLRRERLEDARMFHTTMQNTKRTCVELMREQLQTLML